MSEFCMRLYILHFAKQNKITSRVYSLLQLAYITLNGANTIVVGYGMLPRPFYLSAKNKKKVKEQASTHFVTIYKMEHIY
jgi:hypothetical protein